MNKAILRRRRGLLSNRLLLLHWLLRRLISLRLRRYRLMVYGRLRRLITLLWRGCRLLIMLSRLLGQHFRRRRKQRLAWTIIDQRFHRRELIVRR